MIIASHSVHGSLAFKFESNGHILFFPNYLDGWLHVFKPDISYKMQLKEDIHNFVRSSLSHLQITVQDEEYMNLPACGQAIV